MIHPATAASCRAVSFRGAPVAFRDFNAFSPPRFASLSHR